LIRDLAETLEAIVTDAIALTTGDPAARSIDAAALLATMSSAVQDVIAHAAEIVPVLTRLDAALDTVVAKAPQELVEAHGRYEIAHFKKRHPDSPEIPMPREIAAFVVRRWLQDVRASCAYELARARYRALRMPGDRCDCRARVESSFFYRPEAPLTLLDSAGVPFAAMDYLWKCDACGTKWFEDEGHDDMGSHSTWRLAPSDATEA
jgi:hypothetical protein